MTSPLSPALLPLALAAGLCAGCSASSGGEARAAEPDASRAFVPTPQVEEVHDVRWIPLDALTTYPNARLRRLAMKTTAVVAAFSAGRPAA